MGMTWFDPEPLLRYLKVVKIKETMVNIKRKSPNNISCNENEIELRKDKSEYLVITLVVQIVEK